MTGCCEHGYELSGSIKSEEFKPSEEGLYSRRLFI
jgi:hypothetical protein